MLTFERATELKGQIASEFEPFDWFRSVTLGLDESGIYFQVNVSGPKVDLGPPLERKGVRVFLVDLKDLSKFPITPGVYRHPKGGTYRFDGLERCSETLEIRVSYICVKSGEKWTRPASMWSEPVVWPDGIVRPRFTAEFALSPECVHMLSELPAR